MIGYLEADATGWTVRYASTLNDQPVLVTQWWRVVAINDLYRRATNDALLNYAPGGPWNGSGFSVVTDGDEIRTEQTPIKPPRKRKNTVWVWRYGNWQAMSLAIAEMHRKADESAREHRK